MTMYSFTKAINSNQLTVEIQNSAITVALDHIDTSGTDVSIYFKADLSEAEQTTLSAIVSAHTPAAAPVAQVQIDSDGAFMSRVKAAPTGWSYQLRAFEITTGKVGGGLKNKDYLLNDLTDTIVKCYNAAGTLVTDSADNATIVKTVIDFEPPYDYYVSSGQAAPLEIPESDMLLFVVGVPDYPPNMGGSKVFIQNVNFRYIQLGQKVTADGKAAKGLLYNNPVPHTNKLRFIFIHEAGFQMTTQIEIEMYKA